MVAPHPISSLDIIATKYCRSGDEVRIRKEFSFMTRRGSRMRCTRLFYACATKHPKNGKKEENKIKGEFFDTDP